MVNVANRILEHIGINSQRLLLEWVSAAEGPRFAEVVTTFTNQIREIGPLSSNNPKGAEALKLKLEAAHNAVSGEKLRWVAAKQTEFKRDGNRYGEVFTDHEIGRLLDGVILEEITLQEILLLLNEQPLSVKEIAQKLELPPPEILSHVQGLRKKEQVKLSEIRGRSPLYTVRNNGV